MPGKGPPPEPTALKLLKGTVSRRHNTRNEPQYGPMTPDRPVGLSPGARKFWDSYVYNMGRSGVLTLVDGDSLAALCEDQALLKEMRLGWRAMVAQMRKTLKASGKKEVINPTTIMAGSSDGRKRLSSMATLTTQIIAREREFGLMPGSRSRVEVAPGVPGAKRMTSIEAALCG